jgi:tRNA pseudouridine38-40 synthase
MSGQLDVPDVVSTVGDDDDAEINERWKKERVALVFGYVGKRFQGLQRNPGAFAVEDELEGALHRAGGIAASNLGDFQKLGLIVAVEEYSIRLMQPASDRMLSTFAGWNRCARTDKGVHAMGQVVSLRLRVPRCTDGTVDYAGMRDRVNAQLPSDVRIFDVVKVTAGFNSHPSCSGRRYEYVLPTMVLQVSQLKTR